MGCMGIQKDASLGAGPVAPADPLFAEALSADAAAVAWLTGPLPPTPQSLDVEDPVEQLSQPFHNLKINVKSTYMTVIGNTCPAQRRQFYRD